MRPTEGHIFLQSAYHQKHQNNLLTLISKTNLEITIQKSEINNDENTIKIQQAITKAKLGQHGLLTNARVGSGAVEE
jgi:hypothetical protein